MEPWALGAIDLFHVHTHEELAAARLGPNSCAFVAELDGRVSFEEVKARVARAADDVPELTWRMGRDRRLERVWRAGGSRPDVRERRVHDLLDDVVGLLSEPIDGRAPWRLVLAHGPERDALVLTWFHAATDARGAAQLLGWLGSDQAPPEKRFMTGDRMLEKLSAAERRELTQRYLRHVLDLGRRPILSLQRTAKRRPPGEQRALRVRFGEAETRAFDASLRKRAGLADTSVLLWAAARLVDRLMQRRGLSPVQQVVPLPLSLDPKKGSKRMFGNHLTMMLLALDRDDLADEARAVARLAAQRRDIVRDKLDVAMLAAIRASRHIPRPIADFVARRPFGGERSSFVMSNPGPIEVASALFGQRVLDAYAVPTLLPSPGFQVTVDRFGGRLSVMIMLRDGYVGVEEVLQLVPGFERDILP